MEFNVLIGGEGGQGAFSVELELTEILTRLNYHFFAHGRSLPPAVGIKLARPDLTVIAYSGDGCMYGEG